MALVTATKVETRGLSCAADGAFSDGDQAAEGGVDGALVAEMLGDIRRQQHEIGTCPVAM